MPTVSLTELTLNRLPVPDKPEVTYLDKNGLKGFGVRVTKSGQRSFVVVAGKRRIRTTIGHVGVITLKQARDKAKLLLAERMLNGDDEPSKSFEEATTLFVDMHCKPNNKPLTALETERLLTKHFKPSLGTKLLKEIKTSQVMDVIDRLAKTPSEANHAFVAVKTFFNWALGRGYIEKNPLQAVKKPVRAVSRDRVLDDTELRLVLAYARNSGNYGLLLQLLLHTGQRLGQFVPTFSGTIKGDTIVWPAQAMKGNREHTIPLTPTVRELLARWPDYYNTVGDPHRKFLKRCKVAHFTRHDLRRVFSTYNAGMLRTPPHVVEAIIAHRGGVISGVSAIYNRWGYLEEQRACLERWDEYLASS